MPRRRRRRRAARRRAVPRVRPGRARRPRPHVARGRRSRARGVDVRRLGRLDIRHHVGRTVVRTAARRARVRAHLQRAASRGCRIPQPAHRPRRARRRWLSVHRHGAVREWLHARVPGSSPVHGSTVTGNHRSSTSARSSSPASSRCPRCASTRRGRSRACARREATTARSTAPSCRRAGCSPWFDAVPRFDTGTFGRIPLLMQFGPPLAASVVGAARGAQQRFIELAVAKRPTGVRHGALGTGVRADGGGGGRRV